MRIHVERCLIRSCDVSVAVAVAFAFAVAVAVAVADTFRMLQQLTATSKAQSRANESLIRPDPRTKSF